jgi:hypothetical protein
MGVWEEIVLEPWETASTPCEGCGQAIPRTMWKATVEGRALAFCQPACEELYRAFGVRRATAVSGVVERLGGEREDEPGR